ncbi:MAG: hypothetical protein ABIF87_04805 [Pseudomonadota bacterium]
MGATGFIYVVRSITKDYVQKNFYNVPSEWEERLYFGPCKKPMRPKMKPGDYIFGLSPSGTRLRRIVFAVQIEERISFGEAYCRFPDLRGPEGPIHVRPVKRTGHFPVSHYEHIPGAMHEEDWEADLKTPELDAFFVCYQRSKWLGRWLGRYGPEIDEDILGFFKTCSVYGAKGLLSRQNTTATIGNPIAHGGLYTGLHLETYDPEKLIRLCDIRMAKHTPLPERIPAVQSRMKPARTCGGRSTSRSCR